MNGADVDMYETLVDQLRSSYNEISALSKKSPKDAVNTFKLKFINSTLEKFNEYFEDYIPFPDFSVFEVDSLPSNSDVAFILSQYLEAAERLRADNIYQSGAGSWYWSLDGGTDQKIKTYPPKRLGAER